MDSPTTLDTRERPFQFSITTMLVLVTLLAFPLAGLTYLIQWRHARLAEIRRLAEQDKITVRQIIIDVDAACKLLGRTPKDQEELELVMGKRMPMVHDSGYPTPISYWRTSDTSYQLRYELWATDDWIYESQNPGAGWVQHWY